MTIQECAIIEAYTGICMCSGEKRRFFYEYVDKIMGEPLLTHEHFTRIDEIKAKAAPDFLKLCEEAVDGEPIGVEFIRTYGDGELVSEEACCPNCGRQYAEEDPIWGEPYCPSCGARLNWEGRC